MGKLRRRAILIGLAIAGGAAALVIFSHPLKSKPYLEPRFTSIAVQDNVFPALIYIAQARGYFAAENLNVSIVKTPSGRLALSALLEKKVDFATVAETPLAIAAVHGRDFQIFTSIGFTDQAHWVVARRDQGIEKPSDLWGRRIGVQQFSAMHYFLDTFLIVNRIPQDEVIIEYYHPDKIVAALAANQIDAFAFRSPYTYQARSLLEESAIEFFQPDIYRQYFNLVSRAELTPTGDEVVVRLLRALRKAETLSHHNKLKAIEAVASELGIDRTEEIAQDWDLYEFRLGLSEALLVSMENQGRWYLELVDRNPDLAPNFSKTITSGPLMSVHPGAVTVRR